MVQAFPNRKKSPGSSERSAGLSTLRGLLPRKRGAKENAKNVSNKSTNKAKVGVWKPEESDELIKVNERGSNIDLQQDPEEKQEIPEKKKAGKTVLPKIKLTPDGKLRTTGLRRSKENLEEEENQEPKVADPRRNYFSESDPLK
eukprot:CAMPEP_0115039210 /NCGR_PEP_ID=MMETSP0216-20121206/43872_1 /TAXON_ID=223996 /ORGANISM="Protocruzia adherens, Strain Boccale" /LENGTH=143 /DNA_ID=CAMNT_0002419765 /DNA_START=978 /DNA_END=1409 /DNA_ORIENTATION=+